MFCKDCKHCKVIPYVNTTVHTFIRCPILDWFIPYVAIEERNINIDGLQQPPFCNYFETKRTSTWKPSYFIRKGSQDWTVYEKNGRYISLTSEFYEACASELGIEETERFCDIRNEYNGYNSREECVSALVERIKHE